VLQPLIGKFLKTKGVPKRYNWHAPEAGLIAQGRTGLQHFFVLFASQGRGIHTEASQSLRDLWVPNGIKRGP